VEASKFVVLTTQSCHGSSLHLPWSRTFCLAK